MKNKTNFKLIIYKIFGKARWYLLMIVSSLVFLTLLDPVIMIDESFNIIREYSAHSLTHVSANQNGRLLICDQSYDLKFFKLMNLNTGKTEYVKEIDLDHMLKTKDLDEDFQGNDIALSDDGNIYYSVSVWTDDFTRLKSEKILKLSSELTYIDTVYTINYDNAAHVRAPRMSNINYYEGVLHFAYVDDEVTRLYELDTTTGNLSISDPYETDENGTFVGSVYVSDGFFFLVKSDGSCYKTMFNQPLSEPVFQCSKPFTDYENFDLPGQIIQCGDITYAITGCQNDTVCRLENGGLKKYPLPEHDGNIVQLETYNNQLIVMTSNKLFIDTDGTFHELDVTFKMPAANILSIYFVLICLIFLILGIIGLIINIIIRKKGLLFKQLCFAVPILAILSVIIFFRIFDLSEKQRIEEINLELSAVCELGAMTFDDFDFSNMKTLGTDTNQVYHLLKKNLDRISSNNQSKWSELYTCYIIKRQTDSTASIIAGSDNTYIPGSTLTEITPEESFSGRISIIQNTSNYFLSDSNYDGLYAIGKIYDKNGNVNAYLKVKTDNIVFRHQREEIFDRILKSVIFQSVAIITIIVLLTIRISTTIKNTTGIVSRIAGGDFSARADYKSNDELGQICSQVNMMAQNMEELFNEKDRTEKFYYKFVPEKFRELLGKEKITDLKLGDAESKELTVLFCDIRSFSINSEIMTAKENFEFVNIIYGIAGPIVRKYNGFVDKYIGDAVMALFEIPDDAVMCGIELYREIVLNPETAKSLNISDINIGIGVHTGMARIGIVGENERLSGTVISDTVNLSSRLESLTKQYHTAMLVSKDTIDRMSSPDDLALRYMGIVQVAGVNEVKAIYEVLECLPETARLSRLKNRGNFREAIRLFHLGRKDEGIRMLKSIIDSGNADEVVEMYLNYMVNLPVNDAGKIFRFTKK